jgi:adhesin transport system outer membrane protein
VRQNCPIKQRWNVALASAVLFWVHLAPADQTGQNPETAETISPSALQEKLAIPSGPAPAGSPLRYSVSALQMTEAVRHAVDWHPSIAESIGMLHLQQEEITAARAGYFPELGAGVIAGYDSAVRGDGQGHAVRLYASQMLYDFGKVSSAVDVATAGQNRAQASVLLAVDVVARDTAHAAIEVQRYQALLQTAREQIEGVSAIAALAKMRSDKGASTRSDVLQAQSRIEAARANEQQVLAQLKRWQSVLRNLMGSNANFILSSDFPETFTAACLVEDPELNAVPEMLIADASRAEATALLKEAKAAGLPTFSLDSNVNRYLDDRYVDANTLDEHEASIFLNVSMPLYQGGRTTARSQAAAFALRSADAARDAARLNVIQGLREAQDQAGGLTRSLAIFDLRERAILETRDLYRQQYISLGTRTLLDLLNAEQELQQARREKINALHDLHRQQIDCLYSTGALRKAFQLEGSSVQGVEIWP